jgi:hypothetical protein
MNAINFERGNDMIGVSWSRSMAEEPSATNTPQLSTFTHGTIRMYSKQGGKDCQEEPGNFPRGPKSGRRKRLKLS